MYLQCPTREATKGKIASPSCGRVDTFTWSQHALRTAVIARLLGLQGLRKTAGIVTKYGPICSDCGSPLGVNILDSRANPAKRRDCLHLLPAFREHHGEKGMNMAKIRFFEKIGYAFDANSL